ncbi:MAG: type II secretion system F family protein [Myxococcales bacterium]|nr:MAG: type II secretion system F family protein [Myxococcales bacterium]
MSTSFVTDLTGYLGVGFFTIASAISVYFVLLAPDSIFQKNWKRYVRYLDRELRFLMEEEKGSLIAIWQLVISCLWIFVCVVLKTYPFLIVTTLIAFGPNLWFTRLRNKRVIRLEEQLDGWLLALANSLKASASLGDAIASTQSMLHAPMAQEVDLLLKENKLGTPLDMAIHSMANRIGSRAISSAVVTLLVARQSGGNLPETLEETASALREMARLEGVIRTKTASGKSQAWVLGAIPGILILAIHKIDPMLLRPLIDTFIGNVVATIAVILWASSVIVARKILSVDI